MNEIAAIVITNTISILAIILVSHSVVFILKKIVEFILDSFSNVKTIEGWLSSIKFKKQRIDKM